MKRVSLFLEEKDIKRAKAIAAGMNPPCPWSAVVRAGLFMYLENPEYDEEPDANLWSSAKRVSLFLHEKDIRRAKTFAAGINPRCPWSAVVRAGLAMYLEVAEDAKRDNHKFRLKDGRVRL